MTFTLKHQSCLTSQCEMEVHVRTKSHQRISSHSIKIEQMIFSYIDVFVNGEIQFVSVTHNIQLASLNTAAPFYSLLHSREKTIEITETAVISILSGRFMTLVKNTFLLCLVKLRWTCKWMSVSVYRSMYICTRSLNRASWFQLWFRPGIINMFLSKTCHSQLI